jgi:hypothetical protein
MNEILPLSQIVYIIGKNNKIFEIQQAEQSKRAEILGQTVSRIAREPPKTQVFSGS